jgi:D-alanyl-D-alanine endopeptidase (penicillin-binding protein 7)
MGVKVRARFFSQSASGARGVQFGLWVLGVLVFGLLGGLALPQTAEATAHQQRPAATPANASPQRKVVAGQANSKAKPAPRAAAKPAKATRTVKKATATKLKATKRGQAVRSGTRRAVAASALDPDLAQRPSYGRLAGLHAAKDPLDLASGVALVVDQETNEVLVSKNTQAVLPIASLTKLMTGLIVTEAGLALDERITITEEDIDTEKGSQSRLKVGATLSREEMLHLALMSSENRAANALGRNYPGGLGAFVAAMNAKARQLGMLDTLYAEPTGLSSRNQSSAKDLALLVKEAYRHPILRELTTSPAYEVSVGRQQLQYNNTNSLVRSPQWEIGLQKTGYIVEAGRCLVMQAQLAGRKLIMVFLDSAGKHARIADAERVRKWLLQNRAPTANVQGRAIG